MLARAQTALLSPTRISSVVATGIRIVVAQTTVVIKAERLTPCKIMALALTAVLYWGWIRIALWVGLTL